MGLSRVSGGSTFVVELMPLQTQGQSTMGAKHGSNFLGIWIERNNKLFEGKFSSSSNVDERVTDVVINRVIIMDDLRGTLVQDLVRRWKMLAGSCMLHNDSNH
ncbi:hypothetical protein AMTR_s00049p00086260 [Amborella trichopoda]|uniref:Uncharacterized protein n=1 Tax=Amborella trichopoda TaxID=13333 RepID=W1Q0R7_AMBTC|nr:hypothetical protein AMTR_s00049p00086260 [Amborella trichopoda]